MPADLRRLSAASLLAARSIARAPLAAASLALFAGLAAAPEARAQLTEVEPYWVVVAQDNVNLRCGAGSVFYVVGKVERGQLLQVDGHEFGWLRVRYPDGMPAMVRARDAEYAPDVGLVTLVRESRLLANNAGGGVSESWKQLLDEPLPPETVLEHLETVENSAGEVAGYRVAAPGGARGFISESLIRRATEEEVRRHLNPDAPRQGERPTPQDDAPAQTDRPQEAPAQQTSQAAGEDESSEQAEREAQPETPAQERPPVDQPRQTPEEDVFGDEEGADEQADSPPQRPEFTRLPGEDDAPVAQPQTTREPEAVQPGMGEEPVPAEEAEGQPEPDRAPPTFSELQEALERVFRQPTEGAEYQPLIAEYERFTERLPKDDPDTDRFIAAAESRMQLLRLRLQYQESLQALEEAERIATEGSRRVSERAEELEASPIYRFVGRLTASTVYNGERMPLLYRLQSAETGRTVAYITPAPGLDLTAKIGSIVGVVPESSRDDRSLGLPLINARRVDVIRATQGGSR